MAKGHQQETPYSAGSGAINKAVAFLTANYSSGTDFDKKAKDMWFHHDKAYIQMYTIQKQIAWLIGQGINPSADLSKMGLTFKVPPEVAYVYAHLGKKVGPIYPNYEDRSAPPFGANNGNSGLYNLSSATNIFKQLHTTGFEQDFTSIMHKALTAAATQWIQESYNSGLTPQQATANPRYAQALADQRSGGAAIGTSNPAPAAFSLTGQAWDGVDLTTSYKFALGIPYTGCNPILMYKGKTIDVNHYEGNINTLVAAIQDQYQQKPGGSVFAYIQSHLGNGSFTPIGKHVYLNWQNINKNELNELLKVYQTHVPPNSFMEITKNGHRLYLGETMLGGGPNGVKTGSFANNSMLNNLVATASGKPTTPPPVPGGSQQNAIPPTPGYDAARGEAFAKTQQTQSQAVGAYQAFDSNALSNWAISGFAQGSNEAKVWHEFMGYMYKNAHDGLVYSQQEMIDQFQNFKSKLPGLSGFNLYDAMFPGLRDANKPVLQGGHDMHITEAQYLQGWDRIEQVAASYLPKGFFTKADYAKMVKNGIGVTEMSDRIAKGYAAVVSDPRTVVKFQELFGISAQGLAAHYLDPTKASIFLERQATAAQVASYAGQVGLTGLAGGNNNDATAATNVADLIKGGQLGGQNAPGTPYDMSQFRQAALTAAKDLPLTQRSGAGVSTAQSKVTEQQLLAANMPGVANTGMTTVQAQEGVQKAEQAKSSAFQKGGGYTETQKGVVGAGFVAQ